MNRTGDWREADIQKPQLKKTTSQSAERGEERSGKEKGEKVERAGKEERKEQGKRREKGRKGRGRGGLSPALRRCTASLCCPQQPSSVSTATQFATELIGSLMSQERC